MRSVCSAERSANIRLIRVGFFLLLHTDSSPSIDMDRPTPSSRPIAFLLIGSDAVVSRHHHEGDYPAEDNAPYHAFHQGSDAANGRIAEQGDPAMRGAFKPWHYGCDQPA